MSNEFQINDTMDDFLSIDNSVFSNESPSTSGISDFEDSDKCELNSNNVDREEYYKKNGKKIHEFVFYLSDAGPTKKLWNIDENLDEEVDNNMINGADDSYHSMKTDPNIIVPLKLLSSDKEDVDESCISSSMDIYEGCYIDNDESSSVEEDTNVGVVNNNNIHRNDENLKYLTNLDHLGIDIRSKLNPTLEEIKKIEIKNKDFESTLVIEQDPIPLSILYELSHVDDHAKDVLLDQLAQMIYALSYVIKGTGSLIVQRYESFFCNLYHVDCKTFKQWTGGYTFIDFMKSTYCHAYFKVTYDQFNDVYNVDFNEKDKGFAKLGNEMVAVRIASAEMRRKQLIGYDKKLKYIEDREEVFDEKLKWLNLLRFAPSKEVTLEELQLNFEKVYKKKLDPKYLKKIFIRSTLSKVIKHNFHDELMFVEKNNKTYIKIICDINEAIKTIKSKIAYINSEEYKKAKQLKEKHIKGEIEIPLPQRKKKTQIWSDVEKALESFNGLDIPELHEENEAEKKNRKLFVNRVRVKTKVNYVNNIDGSASEDDSDNE
uniref:RING-type domain-containing protein n=1 Tax=Parastrongyloides trichosuri TaxID=131310 RepID=A0A0N5A521_PARTI